MKHNISITLILISFFVLAQVLGLWLINLDAQVIKEDVNGQMVVSVVHDDTSLGARPETTGSGTLIYIMVGVAIGTILVLLLVRFKKANWWRTWFFLAVWLALSVAIGVVVKWHYLFAYDLALLIALVIALWKIYRPNIFIHNISEVLMYAGIALIFVPMFGNPANHVFGIPENVFWAVILLLLISVYDAYAVWKSKHMVKMAKFQTESKIFAGLMIRYNPTAETGKGGKKSSSKVSKVSSMSKSSKVKPRNAILGGGDVAFPLIFAGVVMESLLALEVPKYVAFLQTSVIILTTTISLGLLFYFAEKDKFYPAMPFITAGCLVGWVLIMILF
jgi:presenilin-like A22 family membrane protease